MVGLAPPYRTEAQRIPACYVETIYIVILRRP